MFEVALRMIALWGILVLLVRVMAPTDGARAERADEGDAEAALARWTTDPRVTSGHLSFAALPDAAVRSWMRALDRAGVPVSYDAPEWAPVALSTRAVADPLSPSRLQVAAPAGSAVAISDAIGPLDTLDVLGAGGAMELSAPSSPIRAALQGVTATAYAPDSLLLRPVLVIGSAGWETKFTVAALEERGWTVLSRMAVAPDVEVTQGVIPPLDTARLAAVVALDRSAERFAPAIVRYLRSGGGVVLGAEAAGIAGFRGVAAGRSDVALVGSNSELRGATPRAGLPLSSLIALTSDAVVLERRGDAVAVAARRVGAGRLVQVGYEESWRWRMAGPDGAPAAHREWWAGVVAGVAYAPRAGRGDSALLGTAEATDGAGALDGAPLAALIDAVGEPVEAATGATPPDDESRMPWWMMAVIVAALLAEWGSRRLRGVH